MAWARAGTSTIVVGVVVALLAASCSGGDDDGGGGAARRLPAPTVAPAVAVRAEAYDWQPLTIGGGGFVTGIVAAVSAEGDPVVYARTDVGGAYRWDEGAGRWHQLLRTGTVTNSELVEADYSVDGIAVAPGDPDTVLVVGGADFNPRDGEAGRAGGRVLRSTDGGATWKASRQRWFVNGNQRFRTGGESLAIDPADPDLVHLGTQRDGLWRSTDGGASWDRVPRREVPDGVDDRPEQDQAGVSLVATVPASGDGPAAVVAGVAGEGVFVSADGGERWDRHLDLEPGEVPSSATVADGELVLSVDTPEASGARLVRLADLDGAVEATELTVPASASAWNVAADPRDGDRLVLTDEAVRDQRLWTSVDGGQRWRAHDVAIEADAVPWLAATELEEYMSAGRLLFDPVVRGRVWFVEGTGAWRTDDLGAPTVTWSSASLGIEELVVSGIVVPPGGAPIVTVADWQGFRFADRDRLPNETLIDPRFASGAGIDYSAGDPTALAWVGAESHLGSGTGAPRGAVSRDGGRTWREVGGTDAARYGGEVAVSATDPDTIVWLPTRDTSPEAYRTDPVGLHRSTDGGRSWDHVRPDGDVDSFHRFFWWFGRRALAADRVDGRFYLLSDEERFYVSDDGGATWTERGHAPPCRQDTDCHVHGQVQAVPGGSGRLWASTGSSGLHRTANAGRTRWERVAGITEARAFAFGAPVGDTDDLAVYVVGRAAADDPLGIYRSIDDGETWTFVSQHPARLAVAIHALAGDPAVPGRVYVGFAGAGVVVGDDPALAGG